MCVCVCVYVMYSITLVISSQLLPQCYGFIGPDQDGDTLFLKHFSTYNRGGGKTGDTCRSIFYKVTRCHGVNIKVNIYRRAIGG